MHTESLRQTPRMDTTEPANPHNPAAAAESYVVGADIGGTNLRVALADGTGSIVGKWSASTVGIRDAQLVVELIAKGVDALLKDSAVPRRLLRAVAAGAPGITDVDAGVVMATSYLMGWRDVPLRSMLESALQVRAAVDNDVNLAALGESRRGAARGIGDFIFIAIGTGVGAGIVSNGQLLRGKSWLAGEVGYMLVPGTTVEPPAENAPGALESILGGEGIKNQWKQAWSATLTELPQDLRATDIFDHAVSGDLLARRILDQSARVLSYAIFNISLILNCPLFVLGGSVGMHPALCLATRTALQVWSSQVTPLLVHSEFGGDAQLIGAIHLALDTSAATSSL